MEIRIQRISEKWAICQGWSDDIAPSCISFTRSEGFIQIYAPRRKSCKIVYGVPASTVSMQLRTRSAHICRAPLAKEGPREPPPMHRDLLDAPFSANLHQCPSVLSATRRPATRSPGSRTGHSHPPRSVRPPNHRTRRLLRLFPRRSPARHGRRTVLCRFIP